MDLKEEFSLARSEKRALAHFNISDSVQAGAIVRAAVRANQPIVIGLSEGERDFLGVPQAVALVRSYKNSHDRTYLNADHTYSFERAKEAIDAGFDSVVIDGAKLGFEENVALTRQCVEYARASGKNILIEGEIGYIGTSSKILEEAPEGAVITEVDMTTVDELLSFVHATQVDLIAPAVGSLHGMVRKGNPKLSIARISELSQASPIPLVLHGGSGTTDEEFRSAIQAGIAMIHINTEIRLAYQRGITAYITSHLDEIAPYRFLSQGADAVEEIVFNRLNLFARTASPVK